MRIKAVKQLDLSRGHVGKAMAVRKGAKHGPFQILRSNNLTVMYDLP